MSANARGMTRLELYAAFGHMSVVEPILINAYSVEEQEIWASGSGESPHGVPWHTSFHASAFPGADEIACGRQQVYNLLGPPEEKPISPHLRSWFDIGKNLELDWVRRFAYYGVLLSADQTAGDDLQTSFVDREHWLTGSSDAIVLPPFWKRGHCVEIKTTSHEKVMNMLQGGLPPKSHGKYKRQLAVYIALAYESGYAPVVMVCKHSGIMIIPDIKKCRGDHHGPCDPEILQLTPPMDGTLIYSSREEPMKTVSFYQAYEPEVMAYGRTRLAEWKDYFLRGDIPPHPREDQKAKWSVDPCQYCRYKAPLGGGKGGCKEDYTSKVADLSKSAIVEFAKTVRSTYTYKDAREMVLERWGIAELKEVEKND
jgi:hypothetical protein